MNFKRLEIYGFKSFADRTVVEFNDGITGIVGPNGSGKSNFSDAIKWVLGEQSPSALRGKKMQDVIFNGTQRRGALSYCEVVLVFDNTNKIFPTLTFDEVSISRKLFRSGESEYYLNKLPCRLKDIKDIIRDTGLGKDGYSIIGQGRVAEIINAKPESRRIIFEEAAGISKYKSRKTESENKLDRTKEHLERLGDIIREIERRLGPLEKQSIDAKKYVEYYNELKDLEINQYLYTYDSNKSIKQNINVVLKGISEEISNIHNALSDCDIKYNKTLGEVEQTDSYISKLRDDQTRFMLDEQKMLGQGELFTERLSNLFQESEKLKNNIIRQKEMLEEKSIDLSENISNEQEFNKKLQEIRQDYSRIEANYTSVVDEIISKEHEMESSNMAMLEAMNHLSDIKTDMGMLNAEYKLLIEKKGECEFIIEKDKRSIEAEELIKSDIKKKINTFIKDRNDIYNQTKFLRVKCNELKVEQNKLNSDIRNLSGSISSYETKTKILNDIKTQYEGFTQPIKRLMQECKEDEILRRKVLGVVAEVIKVPQELETAIEVALGASLQNVITATDDDIKYIIEVLKTKKFGRITFLPINAMRQHDLNSEYNAVFKERGCLGVACKLIQFDKKYNTIMSSLLGSTIFVDNYDNALYIAKKYNRGFRIVTLEGEVLSTQGSVTGGSKRVENSANILSQEREMEQAQLMYAKVKKDYEQSLCRLKEVEIDYDSSFNLLKELEGNLTEKEVQYATESEKENVCTEKLERFLEHLTEYSANNKKISQRIEEIDKLINSADIMEGNISEKRANMDDIKEKTRAIFDDKKIEKDKLSEQMMASRIKIAEIEGKLSNLEEEIEWLKKECNNINFAILEDESNLAVVIANIKQTENKLSSATITEKDKAKLDAIQAKIKFSEEHKRNLNLQIAEINSLKDAKNIELNIANEKRVKQESQIEKIDGQLLAMTQRLQEEYLLNHDSALEFKNENFEPDGVSSQIASLKRNITKLGTVNVASIEEFETEGARYRQLCSERDDLIAAENDLIMIIKDLSKEMKERFNTEFAKISKNFEQTFKDIFGGGKGELVIDKDCEDELEAGIEIYAQPPGKKLGQISLFSGGEMALTAIAILLAILKTRPMPFCVLDEIEAALDESNARLFAKYLKKFVLDTQFIVITHRKPTMEQADRLYGVTMEEKGVSKVVSVQLNEAVKQIQTEQQQS